MKATCQPDPQLTRDNVVGLFRDFYLAVRYQFSRVFDPTVAFLWQSPHNDGAALAQPS